MKKSILLVTAALLAAGAWAHNLGPKHISKPLPATVEHAAVDVKNLAKAPAKAEEAQDDESMTMDFSPAAEPYQALGFKGASAGAKYGQAFQFTKENATVFAGNKVTKIFFYTGVNAQTGANNVRKATVFLADDIDAEPFYTQQIELPDTRFTQVYATLQTPYEIEAGKTIFVGVTCAVASANDYPIVIDYTYHTDDVGGWVGFQPSGTETMTWDNLASNYGFVNVGITIEGTNLPSDMIAITDSFVTPVATVNEQFELDLLLCNNAANLVNDVDLEIKLGDGEPQSHKFTFDEPLSYNEQDILFLDLSYPAAVKNLPLTATITKVNGEPNADTNNKLETVLSIVDANKSYPRNAVIEEFTGIWCGYCPIGIVAMEAIREDNNDGAYIPVAVHYDDDLTAASYSKVVSNYCDDSVPSAVINRWYSSYPELDYLLEDLEFICSIPAIASVTATATLDETNRKITVDTETQFSFDSDGDTPEYILSYGITEDKVGPYQQHNYYTGTDECPGWGDQGEYVTTIYNDVARQLDRYSGIAESVPTKITAGEKYTFSHTINASTTITDLKNCNIVVYLTNTSTGIIENAYWIQKGDVISGIETVRNESNSNAPVEYFNLQGIRVAEPQNGLFIRRQGNSVTKSVVR